MVHMDPNFQNQETSLQTILIQTATLGTIVTGWESSLTLIGPVPVITVGAFRYAKYYRITDTK